MPLGEGSTNMNRPKTHGPDQTLIGGCCSLILLDPLPFPMDCSISAWPVTAALIEEQGSD